jgi:hypothetical protein
LTPPSTEAPVACAVRAFGTLRASGEALPPLRQTLQLPGGQPLPTSFLKHSDEQTVVGLAAVFQAIQRFRLTDTPFTQWGVLAAPRFMGRATLAVALQRFALEGAWGVSPHLIPHRSLHSLSGTVSQALAIHGPNFGVGGGAQGAAEILLAAAALLADGQAPGVWCVLTGWDPEPVLEPPAGFTPIPGPRAADAVCSAVALALTVCPPAWDGPCLSLHLEAERPVLNGKAGHAPHANGRAETLALFQLEGLLEVLADGRTPSATWRLGSRGRVTFERGAETSL